MRKFMFVFILFQMVMITPKLHANSCSDVLKNHSSNIDLQSDVNQEMALQYKQNLILRLKEANVPSIVRVHPDGSLIPIVLLSNETSKNPLVASLLNETMGMGIDISKGRTDGNDVDHGLARAGHYLVDIIRQGDGMHINPETQQLIFGSTEFWDTAIRVRNIFDYMNQRNPFSRVQIELGYLASPQEKQVAIAYHNMRRAGLVIPVIESVLRFEAGYDFNNLSPRLKSRRRVFADRCTTINCFTNYMGTRGQAQIDAMKWNINNLSGMDTKWLMSFSNIQKMIQEATTQLARADWRDPEQLNPNFLNKEQFMNLVNVIPGFGELNLQVKIDVMSYLVGISTTENYLKLINNQGANVYAGIDSNPYEHWPNHFANIKYEMDSANPRAVVVFVYSDSPEAPEQIRNGSFEYKGAIWGIWKNGMSPDGNQMISIDEALKRIPQ